MNVHKTTYMYMVMLLVALWCWSLGELREQPSKAYDWILHCCLRIHAALKMLVLLDKDCHDYQYDLQGHLHLKIHLTETYCYSNHWHEHFLQGSALREPYESVMIHSLAGEKKASDLDLLQCDLGSVVMASDSCCWSVRPGGPATSWTLTSPRR